MTRLPWWVQVLGVHAVARGLGALILATVATTQAANGWTAQAPSYGQYAGLMWDAGWYKVIAEQGYPQELPVGADGRVQQSALAFFPLFPFLVRPVLALGVPWHVAAPTMALVLSGLAMLVVHRVVAHAAAGPAAADLPGPVREAMPLTTVALLSAAPAAPVLQVGYTEALALLLLACVLWALQRERYGLAAPAVVALGLTRAVALPLVVVVAAHAAAGWRADRLAGRRAAVGGLGLLAGAAGLLWPAIVGWRTGVPDAFTLTQGAWRGRGEVVPLLPWLDVARWLFGPLGWLVLGLLAAGLTWLVLARGLRRLGWELWGWTAGYLGYLVVAVEPGTSLVRFALLALGLAGVLAQRVLLSRRPATALGALLLAGLVGQIAWVALVWRLVPPAGWPP